jgi:AraC-like DNA-binding protein
VKPPRLKRPGTAARRPAAWNQTADNIRFGPLVAIPTLLGEFGVDPIAVLEKAGLDERSLADPDGWTSFDTAGRLLTECIEATGCQHFGLLLGQRFTPATLGVVFQLMKHAASLREAIRSLVFHLHLHDRGGVGYVLRPSAGEIGLAYGIYHRGDFQVGPLYDFTASTIFSFMRELCGPRWKPTRLSFAHRRPNSLSPYRRLFGAPLAFDAEHTAVFFAERWLDQPVHGSDPALQAAIAKLVRDRETAEALSMSDKVRRVLRTMVLAGTASADSVAFMFAMSRRSLHRQLQAEGTSLQALANATRFEVARQLLNESDMPAGEIAAVLHYSDASAFSRAFKDWSGTAPREWRERVRRASAGAATGRGSAAARPRGRRR